MVRMLGRGLFAMVTVTAAAGTACRDSTNPVPNADVMPPVLGTLVVSTSTTGAALDPDGYTVTVDGTLSQPVGTSGSVTFDSLVSGPHRVELAGVAENCTVIGANPQTDPVPAGDTARAAFAVSCASVRIIGLGQIQDAWTPPSWWDEFNFDVRSDLTGKLVYNEHWYRTDGSYVTLVVDPSDPETGITGFKATATACADSTRGVEFDGVSREVVDVLAPQNVGSLVVFHAVACDNGPSGSGLDFFSFAVPGVEYLHSGLLTTGDIAKASY